MTVQKFIRFKIVLAAVLFISFAAAAFDCFGQTPTVRPQQQAEPNYEIVLQILSASNNPNDRAAEAVPQSLSSVVKKLKAMYSFSDYRLHSTYFQRVANTGSLDFKGVLSGANQDASAPVFSEFSFRQLFTSPDAGGQNSISILSFRFGQRVPIKSASFALPAGAGKQGDVINYEQIGLSMARIGLPLNTPTIIGNLSATKPDELSFLILTVKPAE